MPKAYLKALAEKEARLLEEEEHYRQVRLRHTHLLALFVSEVLTCIHVAQLSYSKMLLSTTRVLDAGVTR